MKQILGSGGFTQKLALFVGGLVTGIAVMATVVSAADEQPDSGAYLVVAGTVLDPDGLEAYRMAAGPAAQKAGIRVIARSATVPTEHVLEGRWPYEGSLTLERFDSMDALLSFWHSDDYQKAIPLRKGKVELDFVVAVQGI